MDSVFVRAISPPCLGLRFCQTTKNYKFSLYPFLTFFSTRVLETHLGGLKAACIGPALSKFRPSAGDGATISQLVPIKALEPKVRIFGEFSIHFNYGDISEVRCSFARAGAGLPMKSKGDFHGDSILS